MNITSVNKFKALILVLCLSIVSGGFGQAFASVLSGQEMTVNQVMPDDHAMLMQHVDPEMGHQAEDIPCVSTTESHDCCDDHSNCSAAHMACVAHCATAFLSQSIHPVLVLDLRGVFNIPALAKPALADITAPFRPPRY